MSFEQDILSRDTNLFPIVTIGEDIRISTNSVTLNDEEGNPQYYKPLLLNVPSLKESIDLEKRNYKISNVTLNISNYEHEGVRFSEMVADTSLINQSVNISWVSPTGQKLIYQGQVRRYEHDDEKVKLTVEDRSQATLHKDLPLPENYLTEETVPEYNLNKPIPQVYGHVDRSPCIISSSPFAEAIGSEDTTLLLDSSDVVKIQELYVFKDQAFISTPSVVNKYFNYLNGEQWKGLDNVITFEPYGSYVLDEGANVGLTNAISFNHVLAYAKVGLSEAIPTNGSLVEGTASRYDGANTTVIYDGDVPIISGTIVREPNIDSWNGESLSTGYAVLHGFDADDVVDIEVSSDVTDSTQILCNFPMLIPLAEHASGLLQDTGYLSGTMKVGGIGFANFQAATAVNVLLRMGGAADGDYVNGYAEKSMYVDPPNNPTTNYPGTPSEPQYGQISVNEDKINQFRKLTFYIYPYDNTYDGGLGMIMECHDVYVDYYAELEELHKLDFFADVKGRAMEGENSPTATQLISHLMEEELGVTGIVEDDTYDWQYAFTIHEKINSKKLLEGIASTSPYIPRFNNMGAFKFDVIKKTYGLDDINSEAKPIEEADVINFSFSRTKIEDVYSKVELKWYWDYGLKELVKNETINVTDLTQFDADENYFDYYGLKDDHSESTLVIDDDRGKYIRNEYTAKSYARWMLYWHCQQHLKIKVKLPLKYLNIEIGNLIKFDKVLGDVKPYGIDYQTDEPMAQFESNEVDNNIGALVNGLQAYPLFMCISTNKTLEFVEIEVIQLHNLNDGLYTRMTNNFGCTNPAAWNYDSNADVDDESCVFDVNFFAQGCPLEANPTGELAGTELADYSINYVGDEAVDPSLPNVFIIHDETEREAVIAEAQNYHGEGGVPIIYDYVNCTWTDTIPHQLMLVKVQYKNTETGGWGLVEQIIYPSAGLNNAMSFNLNEQISNQYDANNGIEMRITWLFVGHDTDDPDPTFSNDAIFTHGYTANGVPVTDAIIPKINPYSEFAPELFFKDDVLQLGDDPVEVMAMCSLAIQSNPQYVEIPNTMIPIVFQKFIPEPPDYILGDLNDDGGINVLDIVIMANMILNGEYLEIADMNSDGGLNVLDIVMLVDIIVEGN